MRWWLAAATAMLVVGCSKAEVPGARPGQEVVLPDTVEWTWELYRRPEDAAQRVAWRRGPPDAGHDFHRLDRIGSYWPGARVRVVEVHPDDAAVIQDQDGHPVHRQGYLPRWW